MTPAFIESLPTNTTDAECEPGADLPIMLLYTNDDLHLTAKETFHYLPNPVIEDYHPKDTILK